MKCEACKGTGDGVKDSDGRCSICDGSGEVCDICGEATEPGQNICVACQEEDEEKEE